MPRRAVRRTALSDESLAGHILHRGAVEKLLASERMRATGDVTSTVGKRFVTISAGMARVQQRIAELHPASKTAAAPPPGRSSTEFSTALAAQMRGGAAGASASVGSAVQGAAPGGWATDARSVTVPAWPTLSPLPSGAAPSHPSSLYRNGRIPAAALDPIGRGEHRLWGPAAASFTQLLAEAERAGVHIGVTDSYRSYDQQVDVARRKGLYSEGGLAAKPGTSQHGWGLAVDLDLDAAAQSWMRTHGGRYGFVEDTPREPWHWAYKGR